MGKTKNNFSLVENIYHLGRYTIWITKLLYIEFNTLRVIIVKLLYWVGNCKQLKKILKRIMFQAYSKVLARSILNN